MARKKTEVEEVKTTETVVEEAAMEETAVEEENVEEVEEDEEESVEELLEENAVEVDEIKTTNADEKAAIFKKDIELEDAFFRRTITLASKRGRRKVFHQERVIGDEYGEIETEGSQRKKEYDILSDSAKASKPKILTGRVYGVEPIEVDKGIKTVYAKVNLICDPSIKKEEEEPSLYTVNIPAQMFFFNDNPEKYEGAEGFELLYRDMQARTGSLVNFIVYNVQANDDNVLASRIGAMQLKSYDMYLGKNKQIEVGSIALGNVTYVGKYGIQCEICGAECYIPNEELSWNHISAANNVFEVGDKVKVKILSIDTAKVKVYGRNYSYIKVTASIKQASPNPAEKYFNTFVENAKYNGVIQMRLDTGEYFVNLGGRMTCKCKAPSFGSPRIGQECVVTIIKKNHENKTINGIITYLGR